MHSHLAKPALMLLRPLAERHAALQDNVRRKHKAGATACCAPRVVRGVQQLWEDGSKDGVAIEDDLLVKVCRIQEEPACERG